MSAKKFNILVAMGILLGMVFFMIVVIGIDPYFHYHKPIKYFYYPINEQRYQNNGIVKLFTYDALITGTSMTENFKTSELDALFGTSSIKVPYMGGSYKEINENVLVALEENPNLKLVVRGLDYDNLFKDKNYENFEAQPDYPKYMIDTNIFNDVNYLFNKDMLILSFYVIRTYGKASGYTSFDDYANWTKFVSFGRDITLSNVEKIRFQEEKDNSGAYEVEISQEEQEMVRENILQNVVATAEAYPETMFYIYFTPYSICFWDEMVQDGKLGYHLVAEKIAIEEMLKCENIKLFSFSNNYEWICNLDNYKDVVHHGEWINSAILQNMYEDKYRITKENYEVYLEEMEEFFYDYDYSQIYEDVAKH